jgi:cytochrome c biogenesis protein CcdA
MRAASGPAETRPLPVGLVARPRAFALVVAAFAAAITAAVALTAPTWTPVAAGGALLAGGFALMAPCELQMATVLARMVGRSPTMSGGARGIAVRFTLGYIIYYIPVAIVIGGLAHLAGADAWVLAAAGGAVTLTLGLATLGAGGPAWLKRCRGPLYLLRSGRASFRRPLRAGMAFGQYCSTCCGPYAFALAVFAGAGRHAWLGVAIVGAYAVLMALPFLVPTLIAPARSAALSDHLDTVRPTLERAAGLSLVTIGALVVPISLISGMAGRW